MSDSDCPETGSNVIVRNTREEDFAGIEELCRRIYPEDTPWKAPMLATHRRIFPEGQFVAVRQDDNCVVGFAASLIIKWDDYEVEGDWIDFTDNGTFTNHDPENGRTLYGAEVMVDSTCRRQGIGKKIYAARRELVESLGLLRIRAGSRLRGYGKYANRMTPREYVIGVMRGEIADPTLTFQLRQGFVVLGICQEYLESDPESRGKAAIIEWVNKAVAREEDYRVPHWEAERK